MRTKECIVHPSSVLLLIAPAERASNQILDKILADPPTDPASVAVILLLLVSVGAAVWFGRSQGPPG
jgi:hypothetical protein